MAPKVAVVMAAKDAQALIARAVTSVVPQLGPGDEMIVVDNGSADGTAEIARAAGARVIDARDASGPYEARNLAVAASNAENIVFFDTRCTARSGWLDAHRRMLAVKGNGFSYTSVSITPGQSLASKVAAMDQYFMAESYVRRGEDIYFPACNLGVRRSVFLEAGGFPISRTGADWALCRKIREDLKLDAAWESGVYADWSPRQTMSDLWEQMERYGRGFAIATRLNRGEERDVGRIALSIPRIAFRGAKALTRGSIALAFGAAYAQAAHEWGYAKAIFRRSERTLGR